LPRSRVTWLPSLASAVRRRPWAALLLLLASGAGGGCHEPAVGNAPPRHASQDATVDHRDGGLAPDATEANDQDADRPVELCLPASELTHLAISVDPADLQRVLEAPDERIELDSSVRIGQRHYRGVEFELHGGLARRFVKKSFRLKFRRSQQPRLDLFGDGPEPVRRIVLQASWVDTTFVRNKLTMDLVRASGGLAPRIGHVLVELNGLCMGLYAAIERIDDDWLARQGLAPQGNLYKAENHYANWTAAHAPTGFAETTNADGDMGDLLAMLGALQSAPADHGSFRREVEPRLSLEDFFTWHMVHTFAMNQDTFTKNFYFYHDPEALPGTPEDRFRLVSWDADATFGNNWDGQPLHASEDWLHGGNRFSPRLFGIPEYWTPYLRRFEEALREGPLRVELLQSGADDLRASLHAEARWDLQRWHRGVDYDAEMDRLDEVLREREEALLRALAAARGL